MTKLANQNSDSSKVCTVFIPVVILSSKINIFDRMLLRPNPSRCMSVEYQEEMKDKTLHRGRLENGQSVSWREM